MYTPPTHHNRTLFTVRARSRADGLLRVYVETLAFPEFYPVSEGMAVEIFGASGWRRMTSSDVADFVAGLNRLFDSAALSE